MSYFKKITTGVLAGATLLTVASPAEAQWRHRRGGDRTALAVSAGALGLAVGAAIASGNRNRGYYGRGYDGYYGGGRYDGYYGRPYAYGYGRGYDGYYDGPRRYAVPRARCWNERQWDDWRGRWRRVRVCDRY